MSAFLACPVNQIWGYNHYIADESPYSTQQGIKGAEFERVLVIIDDEEGNHPQFSYDKLMGLKQPSATDEENRKQGKDTILDRTRRLFYVCCSRAMADLAVVLYHRDAKTAAAHLKTQTIFPASEIYTLEDLGT
jgi:DNA helicase-2/ATP-dependent DNA helicase PcrA